MKCPYCGSDNIEEGVAWGRSTEVGNFGLKYKSSDSPLSFAGVTQVYSDLCLDCKSIVRSYIREDTDKVWNHRSGTLGSK